MTSSSEADLKQNYQTHFKHLKLKGLQPKTIEAYARAMRRIGAYFDYQIDDLSESQLTDYFSDLLESHSWSSVKLDLYGIRCCCFPVATAVSSRRICLPQRWIAAGYRRRCATWPKTAA
ncbi:MAG: phage integrase N-terminal SAM-like domain-containing protein [Methylococcales bacterium]|nr:phage integrase N-terminal SAM-like domain-containing protein [Methylococcales bacterium]